jgi:S1-C subfamily serine protease
MTRRTMKNVRLMRRKLFALTLAGSIAAAVVASLAFARGAATIGTGVVTITTNLGYEGGEAEGTGMVLTSSGEILTNNHVIDGATSITVAVPGTGHHYSAQVVGYDVTDDVALLQLRAASDLKTISVATSAATRGEKVRAVGNAGGTGSLTSAAGRVTGVGKTITAGDEEGNSETLTGLVETNAGVVAGDSGGPLLDTNGDVVAMTTAASTGGGNFGFQDTAASDAYAIPIAKAVKIANEIKAGTRTAAIHIGPTAFLGIQVSKSDTSSGALIVGVVSGGPSAAAGLTAGDLITRVDGRTVATPSAVGAIVSRKQPGTKVQIRYLDEAGAHSVTVKLGTGPPR